MPQYYPWKYYICSVLNMFAIYFALSGVIAPKLLPWDWVADLVTWASPVAYKEVYQAPNITHDLCWVILISWYFLGD